MCVSVTYYDSTSSNFNPQANERFGCLCRDSARGGPYRVWRWRWRRQYDANDCDFHDANDCDVHDANECDFHDADDCDFNDADDCDFHDANECDFHDANNGHNADHCGCASAERDLLQ